MTTEPIQTNSDTHLSGFEKYLAIWVVVCMLLGTLLSRTIPGMGIIINSWQIYGISIPIGI